MPTDAIAALPVAELAAPDAALFLWFTGSFMPDALQVCEGWGFQFTRVDKVWKKVKISGKPHAVCGQWGMSDAEFILLGVRGQMCKKQSARNQHTIVEEPYPGRHSEKPQRFRDLIEARFPYATRLELFARDRAPGWDAWGDELADTNAGE